MRLLRLQTVVFVKVNLGVARDIAVHVPISSTSPTSVKAPMRSATTSGVSLPHRFSILTAPAQSSQAASINCCY
jgi:hypothetical protein